MKISADKCEKLICGGTPAYPKYLSQLINLANSNSHATRPKNVGSMVDMVPKFKKKKDWEKFYRCEHYDKINFAVETIDKAMNKLRRVFYEVPPLEQRKYIRIWVEDLIFNKSFVGINAQMSILPFLAEQEGKEYRFATIDEEAKGIDGFIGDDAVSLKPKSYKSKGLLPEKINCKIIYYNITKRKDVEFDYED
jgi:hypothetical protein